MIGSNLLSEFVKYIMHLYLLNLNVLISCTVGLTRSFFCLINVKDKIDIQIAPLCTVDGEH